MVESGEYAF